MCDCTIRWERDADVEGAHDAVPISCNEVRDKLVARVTELESILAVGGYQMNSLADNPVLKKLGL